jgi:hypothetical protein
MTEKNDQLNQLLLGLLKKTLNQVLVNRTTLY